MIPNVGGVSSVIEIHKVQGVTFTQLRFGNQFQDVVLQSVFPSLIYDMRKNRTMFGNKMSN